MIPYIQKDPACFIVDGKPFIAFAGEIHNSNASTIESFQKEVIDNIQDVNINTLLVPVYWENIEPKEGQFDFSLVQALIDILEENQLKGIFLWFGLWKNGLSTYVPEWMKQNREQYPFCENEHHEKLYTITPLCQEAIEKDCNAYKELMRFLKEYDQKHTILMMQIENESGLIGSNRDYSFYAQEYFDKELPQEVATYFDKKGTWKDLGNDAHELFMIYYFAKAINYISKSGKEIYSLCTMTNVWLSKVNEKPGKYPSGGAVCHHLDFYKYLTPYLDVVAPDVYTTSFKEVCDVYAKQGILLIPETRQDKASISQMIYGFSKYPLICYSPFGIEDFYNCSNQKLYHFLSSLGIQKDAFDPTDSIDYLSKIYKDLFSMQTMLLQYRNTSRMHSFLYNGNKSVRLNIDTIDVDILFLNKEKDIQGAGFILALDEEWYIYGVNFFLKPCHQKGRLGILSLEEGMFHENTFIKTKVLNGDEQYGIYALDEPKLFRVRFHIY